GKPQVASVAGSPYSIRYDWLMNPAVDEVDSYYVFGSDWPGTGNTPTPIATVIPTATGMNFSMSPTPGLTPWNVYINHLVAHNSVGFGPSAVVAAIPVGDYQVAAVVPVPTRAVKISWTMIPTPG